jgi:hypothetical protein
MPDSSPNIEIYFSDFFEVPPAQLMTFGAFNISLINDLPLFIDPFLLFNSDKPEYRALHDEMIRYVRFLRDKSAGEALDEGLISLRMGVNSADSLGNCL